MRAEGSAIGWWVDDEIIETCRFCISEKFEESCLKGKRFFEKSRVTVVGPESSGLALDSKLLENPYGASASRAVLIQRGEVFVFARAFSFGGHYYHVYYGFGACSVLGLF